MRVALRSLLPHYTTKRLIFAAIIAAIGAILFFSIYDGVHENGDLARLDQPVLLWVVAHRTHALTTLMTVVTNVFSPVGLSAIILVGAALWAKRSRDTWRPFLLVGAMVLAYIFSVLVKSLTGRSRPPQIDMIPPFEMSYSFPSGHTLGIATCLLVLGYLVLSRRLTGRRAAAWLLIVMTGIAIVAFSRLYLGYHWLTDVSASVGLALIILAAIILIDPLSKRFPRLQKLF